MDFQLKIHTLLNHIHPSPFTTADKLILYTLLARICDATDLTDSLQWFHVMRSLLAMYAVVYVFSYFHTSAPRTFNVAIAKGIRQWFITKRPLHIAPSERERCMNELMFFMANELKQTDIAGSRDVAVTIEVLSYADHSPQN